LPSSPIRGPQHVWAIGPTVGEAVPRTHGPSAPSVWSTGAFLRRYYVEFSTFGSARSHFAARNSGSFAIFAAIRRACLWLAAWQANAGRAHPRNRHRQAAGRFGRAQQSRRIVHRQTRAAGSGGRASEGGQPPRGSIGAVIGPRIKGNGRSRSGLIDRVATCQKPDGTHHT
jgi:hypothetical protein